MPDLADRIHYYLVTLLHIILTIELGIVIYEGIWNEGPWINAFLIMAIIVVTLIPSLLGRQYHIHIPAEFQILAVVFVFATLFLGEIHRYYERWWWWDIVLHTSSGLLLGVFGFLLVYVLNENDRVQLALKPRFVALFAFMFAVTAGVLWEVFEFAMDRLFGLNMQKPMAGDYSGLTDTMWDLIVDILGALVISLLGWWYLAREESSFIQRWIRKFIDRNPRLFHRRPFQRRR